MPILTIDNRKIEVPAGTKVIDAAERLGIVIPRFCYHPALGSVGACRVCAVAFREGPVKGIQMSCMVDAQDGMVVSSTDAEAVDFRRHVIEFLMLNHPHDCPVCDEGGHCLLQDLTVAGGHGRRRYQGPKRTHRNQELGPLVEHEMNRCIQCYRCSRYYQEYTGYRDLGVMGIGSRVYFGRHASGTLASPFAGNLIDICPTGVYTDKPSRYVGRRWDFQRQPIVCIHCSLGCSLTASARYRQVVRHEARFNPAVNGHFICDRGRYATAYASADDRPRQALSDGSPGAVQTVMAGAREAIARTVEGHGPEGVAIVASPRCSLETLAAVKRVCARQGWTGPAVTADARQAAILKAAVNGLSSELAVSLADVGEARDVLVIGADPLNEAPMLALALRQVHRRGGRVSVIDPRGVQLPFAFDRWAVHPAQLTGVVQALLREIDGNPAERPPHGDPAAGVPVRMLARHLNGSPRPVVVCGTAIGSSADVGLAADLARVLCRTHITAGLFYTLSGANAFAMALADDHSCTIQSILERIEGGRVRTLVVVETDLWTGVADRERLRRALQQLDHLVVLDYVHSPLIDRADRFLPTQTLYECGGHWINNEGRLQAGGAVMVGGEPIAMTGGGNHPPRVFARTIPGSDPQPAWSMVMALSGDHADEQTLRTALRQYHPAVSRPLAELVGARIDLSAIHGPSGRREIERTEAGIEADAPPLTLLVVDQTFGTEPLAALSRALAPITPPPSACMHPDSVARYGLIDGGLVTLTGTAGQLTLPLRSDSRMAANVVIVPRHHQLHWQVFGATRVPIAPPRMTTADD